MPDSASTKSGSLKVSSANGPYLIPAGPSAGTSVTSGTTIGYAVVYGSWTQMIASAAADLLILAVVVNFDNARTYLQINVGVGAGGSEVSIGETLTRANSSGGAASVRWGPFSFEVPLEVASGERIALQCADDTTALAYSMSLLVINKSDLKDI